MIICKRMADYIDDHCEVISSVTEWNEVHIYNNGLGVGDCIDSETNEYHYYDRETEDEFHSDDNFLVHVKKRIQGL